MFFLLSRAKIGAEGRPWMMQHSALPFDNKEAALNKASDYAAKYLDMEVLVVKAESKVVGNVVVNSTNLG